MLDKTTIIIMVIMIFVITLCSLFRKLERRRARKGPLGKYIRLIESCQELQQLSQKHSFYLDVCLVSFISFCYFFFFGVRKKDAFFLVIAFGLLIFSLILMTKILGISNIYNSKYKDQIVKKIFQYERTDLQYFPYAGINQKDYEETRFNKFDKFESEDLIQGFLPKGNRFVLSDVITYLKVDYQKTNVSTYSQNFHGAVAILDLKKSIESSLYVLDKTFLAIPNEYNIDVENKRFAKEYDIIASNKLIAKKLLNKVTIDKILELKDKYKISFEININNAVIYFRFHSKNLFNPSITDTQQEAKRICQYFEIIDDMIDIMNNMCSVIEDSI